MGMKPFTEVRNLVSRGWATAGHGRGLAPMGVLHHAGHAVQLIFTPLVAADRRCLSEDAWHSRQGRRGVSTP